MKKIIYIVVVSLEVVSILFISTVIYKRFFSKNKVLGTVSVAPISKSDVVIYDLPELKYYFEYKPNENIEVNVPWLSNKVTYSINKDTLNDRYNYSVEKPDNVFRIVALGDSFTFGQLVNTADSWPERLEDMLNNDSSCNGKKFEVINLGMPNFGVEYIAYRYKTRGQKYNPDLIVWLESGPGYDRVNELLMPLIDKYRRELSEKELQDALAEGRYVDAEKAYKEMYKTHTKEELLEMVKGSWKTFLALRGDTMVSIVSFSGLSLDEKEFLTNLTDGLQNVSNYNEVLAGNSTKWQLKDGHPSPDGHKMIATSISTYLKNSQLIPCSQ